MVFNGFSETVLALILITWSFAGMRILYGYWPWQSRPKQRNGLSGQFVSYEEFLTRASQNAKK